MHIRSPGFYTNDSTGLELSARAAPSGQGLLSKCTAAGIILISSGAQPGPAQNWNPHCPENVRPSTENFTSNASRFTEGFVLGCFVTILPRISSGSANVGC